MSRFTVGQLYAERSISRTGYVRLFHRYWDGIDRPDYTEIMYLSADDARYLAQQLFAAAEKIDGKSRKDRTAARIARNTESIAKQAKKEAMA